MCWKKILLQFGVFLVVLTTAGFAWPQQEPVKIGVLAFRGKENCLKRWSPTAAYLNESIPGHKFEIIPYTLRELRDVVEQGDIDFLLTNTGHYVMLEAEYGVSRIATQRTPGRIAKSSVFGAVIFTRADREDIRTIRDLKAKRFMAVKRQGFGGFQMAWRKLKENGIDPFSDFSELKFSGFPQDRVAYAVRDGEVDAGTFRTDTLERMALEGKVKLSDFKILDPISHAGFNLPVSTRLYPEWPFAKLRQTRAGLSQKVAIALLQMPPDSYATRAGNYAGWTVPLDYQPVHELFRELQIGPYADLGKVTWSNVVRLYWPWLLLAAALVFLTVCRATWIEHLVRKRTRELSTANGALARQIVVRREAEQRARRRQDELARVARLNTMGEMASGLAHELNHPLATINNYARGCIRRLRSGRENKGELLEALEHVSSQAERAAEVISSLRDFVRNDQRQHRPVDVNKVVQDVCSLLEFDVQSNGIALDLDLAASLPQVVANPVQIEQAILNLARNSIEAMGSNGAEQRSLAISTHANGGADIEIAVFDSGPGVPDAVRDNIFNPFITTKSDGLGLGLSISRSIIEAHSGRLWVSSTGASGSEFRFSLPAAPAPARRAGGG